MRIQKYLSLERILSRREAENYIRKGLIKLNGKIVNKMGVSIDPTKDRVEVISLPTNNFSQKTTVAVYKPRGIVCSKNRAEGKIIFDIFPQFAHLNVVGRLDKDSEGLLLLSNDGVITAIITGDDHSVEKEYEVTVRENISPWHIKAMEEGIIIDNKKTLPAKVKRLDSHSFLLSIREGRHHQIRRMTDVLHLTIERLLRLRIGPITLSDISPGESRLLDKKEIVSLKKIKKNADR